MKNLSRSLLVIGVVVYIVLGIVTLNVLTHSMTQEYYDLLGKKALDIAKLAARNYSITDEEVESLKSMTFEEALQSPANKRFSDMFLNSDFSEDFKYAYIMVKLDEKDVKYHITEENADYFGFRAGTSLDLLWLVDVIINKDEQVEVANTPGYYDDINRYSHFQDQTIAAYENQEAVSVFVSDEYGDSFTGFVPVYTTQGNYIGLLGVDIYYEELRVYTAEIQGALLFVFLLPTIILTLVYLSVYLANRKKNNTEAYTDPMTSLFNRRYLELQLSRMVHDAYQKKQPLSSIMLDIDYFKNYNDHYGHSMGDTVIEQVAHAIKDSIRDKIDVAFRYGGEEFFVLLPDTDADRANYAAEKIDYAIRQLAIPHEFSEVGMQLTISQGIYSAVPAGTEKEDAARYINNADKALYQAKDNGRNRFETFS